jgi:hypothetical protein
MKSFSKSKLMAHRQCAKRLWLEFHRPDLREDSAASEARFKVGHEVGEIARRIYDPNEKGILLDVGRDGYDAVFRESTALLQSTSPVFEAGFAANGAYAFADVMLPARAKGQKGWRMVEVKSSSEVKDYHRDDAAVQAFAARGAGVPLLSIALAHIDTSWTYPGGGDYAGLLVEHDLTGEAYSREAEVRQWIAGARVVVEQPEEPGIQMGRHCGEPWPCGFAGYCESQAPQVEYPVQWLPRATSKGLRQLFEQGVVDMRDVPDDLLNERQLRVKKHTLSRRRFFDAEGAAKALAGKGLPAYFLDFETIQFAVPIWKGTRPYQQTPFQFSLHRLSRTGKLAHQGFLDLSGSDPSKAFAEALIAACGERGPVFAYNAPFENTRIKELAERYPRLRRELLAIVERVVDLRPVAEKHFYHPNQQGSWSIKKVLPAIAPDLNYEGLDGVQDGGMAMAVYLEAIHPETSAARKAEIEAQLTAYCKLDTYAMVRLWQFFIGESVAVRVT